MKPDFRPVACIDIDLARASPVTLGEGPYHVLVRIHGEPLEVMNVSDRDGIQSDALVSALSTAARSRLVAHLTRDTGRPVSSGDTMVTLLSTVSSTCSREEGRSADAPLATIALCTLGREPLLASSVAHALAQDHPNFEVLVVDNDPGSGAVASVLAGFDDARLRYVSEPRRGLSCARNTALSAASGDVVAFTDDDALADSSWLRFLTNVFSQDTDVTAVTGQVLPLEIETEAQLLFEEFGSFDRGCERVVWALEDRTSSSALGRVADREADFPFAAGRFGSGNNMSFRRSRIMQLGGFDTALGAGTRTGGGEDIDALLRVILAGDVIVYEPSALVRHRHRRDASALDKQAFAYGSGLSAMLTKAVLSDTTTAAMFVRRIPAGARRLLDPGSTKNERRSESFPTFLTKRERLGLIQGPLLYLRARRDVNRLLGTRCRRTADAIG